MTKAISANVCEGCRCEESGEETHSPVCPQLTAVANSLIMTKHNRDCNTMAWPSAYKHIIIASANQAASYTGSVFNVSESH